MNPLIEALKTAEGPAPSNADASGPLPTSAIASWDGHDAAVNGPGAGALLSAGAVSLRVAGDEAAGGGVRPESTGAEEAWKPDGDDARDVEEVDASEPDLPARTTVNRPVSTERREPEPRPERPDAHASHRGGRGEFNPRTLRRRRGAVRAIGATLSILAILGAGAGAASVLWKTLLVRPALVRHLPSMPGAVVDLTPVNAANAAADTAATPGAGSSIGEEERAHAVVFAVQEVSPEKGAGRPALRSVPGAAASTRAHLTAGAPVPTGTSEARVAADDGDPASKTAAGRREATATGAPAPVASPVRWVSEVSAPKRPGSSGELPATRDPAPSDATGIRPAPPPAAPAMSAAPEAALATIDHARTVTAHAGTGHGPELGAGIEIRKRVRSDHVAPALERAYAALRTGDSEVAAQAYRAVLAREPRNRDAHLGLAAIATHAGRRAEAAGHYARVLAFHPADTVARAALIAVDEQDPIRRESALKALLRSGPQAAHVHFELGNVYAAQSRWAEAQRSYFNAYRFDGANADHAYNLAVSLDHLSRRQSAVDYYREALALTQSRPAGFDAAAVLTRIRDIDSSTDAGIARARASSSTHAVGPAARVR